MQFGKNISFAFAIEREVGIRQCLHGALESCGSGRVAPCEQDTTEISIWPLTVHCVKFRVMVVSGRDEQIKIAGAQGAHVRVPEIALTVTIFETLQDTWLADSLESLERSRYICARAT